MSIIGSSGSPAIRSLAARTRTEMESVYQSAAKRARSEGALDAVCASADATPLERVVASTARAATRSFSDGTAAVAQGVALSTLASGVGGALGPTLATLARTTLESLYGSSDKRKISTSFLEAVKAHGSTTESAYAAQVLSSVAAGTSDGSTVVMHGIALAAVAKGVPSSGEQALSSFLREVQDNTWSNADKRAVGDRVFQALAATSDLARVTEAMTRQKVSDGTVVLVQQKAADLIRSSRTVLSDDRLAAFAADVRSAVYSSADQRVLTEPVLDALAASANPRSAALAAVTRAASGKMGDSTVVQLQTGALTQLGRSSRDSADVALARLAVDTAAGLYSSAEQSALATHTLSEIQRRTSDTRLKATLDWVAGMPGQAKADAKLSLLKSIVDGRCEIPDTTLKVGNETLTVDIPVVDDGVEPSVRRASLEASVAQNRGVLRRVDALLDKAGAELQPLQQKQRDLLLGIASPRPAAPPPPPPRDRFRAVIKLGELAALGGAAACLAGAGMVGLGIMIGGIVTVVGASIFALSRAGRDLAPRGHVGGMLDDLAQVSEQISRLETHLGSLRRLADNAKRAVEVAEGPLDVLRMADAVNQPVADRTLTVEDTELVIGGIRVPRRAEPQ